MTGVSVFAHGVRVSRDVPAAMRDGTVLRSDVYRPAEPGDYPVLLMRVPYNKAVAQSFAYQHPSWYAARGYVVVIQDCRGRHASDGRFDPIRQEAHDGYDTVEWASTLPESNGSVGMYGFSYAGATQLLAAAEKPPALKCCVPAFTAGDYFDGWMYEGGVLNLAFVLSWTVQMLAVQDAVHARDWEAAARLHAQSDDFPGLFRERPLDRFRLLRETGIAPYFFEWLKHDRRDDYWASIGLPERYDRITVPCLHIGGWYDVFAAGTVRNYTELARRAGAGAAGEQRLIMGPWIHMPWAPEATGPALGESFRNRVDGAQAAWFDRWLKPPRGAGRNDAPGDDPEVGYFVMGSNRWRTSAAWPPHQATTPLYLDSRGQANSRSGDGRLRAAPPERESPADVYICDPSNPVPSAGGNSCCNSAVSPMGQACQAAVEVRNDVLVYTSVPLTEDVECTGTPSVTLYAASTAVDTDWIVRLVDVDPEGRAVNISQGALRARFRRSLADPEPLTAGTVTEFRIAMNPTSWRFSEGHRIRLQVTSSDFPAKDPNRNTGSAQASAQPWEYAVAHQTVFHDERHPSVLHLPARPSASGRLGHLLG
ncbi:CocE/NonD family hydrolase [Actinomadura chibensis]|uniref:CocE/NonD family hydrolase n=1 Tax=Actinomadura chibensis TaxID=392828 RepID=A0A5D0NCD0_9ACTN|nr:CocE/NonD family hydrolase [Actinomadura chibensis]TYB41855.1 CocE/NonD family hydrolase [Actinomadura chibensis]